MSHHTRWGGFDLPVGVGTCELLHLSRTLPRHLRITEYRTGEYLLSSGSQFDKCAADTLVAAQPAEGLAFDLTRPFAGDPQPFTDFGQCQGIRFANP